MEAEVHPSRHVRWAPHKNLHARGATDAIRTTDATCPDGMLIRQHRFNRTPSHSVVASQDTSRPPSPTSLGAARTRNSRCAGLDESNCCAGQLVLCAICLVHWTIHAPVESGKREVQDSKGGCLWLRTRTELSHGKATDRSEFATLIPRNSF